MASITVLPSAFLIITPSPFLSFTLFSDYLGWIDRASSSLQLPIGPYCEIL